MMGGMNLLRWQSWILGGLLVGGLNVPCWLGADDDRPSTGITDGTWEKRRFELMREKREAREAAKKPGLFKRNANDEKKRDFRPLAKLHEAGLEKIEPSSETSDVVPDWDDVTDLAGDVARGTIGLLPLPSGKKKPERRGTKERSPLLNMTFDDGSGREKKGGAGWFGRGSEDGSTESAPSGDGRRPLPTLETPTEAGAAGGEAKPVGENAAFVVAIPGAVYYPFGDGGVVGRALTKGTPVTKTKDNGTWSVVRLKDGSEGLIESDSLQRR